MIQFGGSARLDGGALRHAAGQDFAMQLNRTLRKLRNARDRETPEMFEYDPKTSGPPENVRYITLTEAKSLECNLCGGCCGSAETDADDLRAYTFGPIGKRQWAHLNGGEPLIIPLTPSGKPRAWQSRDAEAKTPPPFQCAALSHAGDGTTRCALWQSRRPPQCDEFPINASHYPAELQAGAYLLLNTKYQRVCTWVDVLVCPDDSVVLGWRKADGTLRRRLSDDRWEYVSYVFSEAYCDLFEIGEVHTLREWRAIRQAEAQWRLTPSASTGARR